MKDARSNLWTTHAPKTNYGANNQDIGHGYLLTPISSTLYRRLGPSVHGSITMWVCQFWLRRKVELRAFWILCVYLCEVKPVKKTYPFSLVFSVPEERDIRHGDDLPVEAVKSLILPRDSVKILESWNWIWIEIQVLPQSEMLMLIFEPHIASIYYGANSQEIWWRLWFENGH